MFAEFGLAPLSLVLDLDTYEGPWTHVAAFRGRSGWLQVARATIQSEHDLLCADLVAACDEVDNPIPAFRATNLTKCGWSHLDLCCEHPPAVLDDLLCEEEGAFYAHWQREMNADVAAAASRAATALEELGAHHEHRKRRIGNEIRRLRRERMFEQGPERKAMLGQAMRALEEEEDKLVAHFSLQRWRLLRQAEAEEEALWDRSDALIEVEHCYTVRWHCTAGLLHGRATLYDRPLYKRSRSPRNVSLRKADRSPLRIARPAPHPVVAEPQQHSAPGQVREEQHSHEVRRLLANLAPLGSWAKLRDDPPPDWATAEVLAGCQQALQVEEKLLAERHTARDVTPRQSAQLHDLRKEMAETLLALAYALRWHRDQAAKAIVSSEEERTADPEPPHEGPAPSPSPPRPAEEYRRVSERRAELANSVERLERILSTLSAFAPRKAGYVAKLRDARAEIEDCDDLLALGAAAAPPASQMASSAEPALVECHWSDADVALLERLWNDGVRAGEIAWALAGRSCNAVIAKAKRLGLPMRLHAEADDKQHSAG